MIEIKNRWTDAVIYRDEQAETLRDAVIRAVANRVSLESANLESANLWSANLRSADLRSANLWSANLWSADLRSANLRSANLPSPGVVLTADWGEVSPQLCGDLMVFDAANHPDPTAFERWAARSNGSCPYSADVKVQRAAIFNQHREHWSLGQPCRPYDLMTRVMAEKCPDWTAERQKEFLAKFAGLNGNK